MTKTTRRKERALQEIGGLEKEGFKPQFDGEWEEGKPDKSPKPDDSEENVGGLMKQPRGVNDRVGYNCVINWTRNLYPERRKAVKVT